MVYLDYIAIFILIVIPLMFVIGLITLGFMKNRKRKKNSIGELMTNPLNSLSPYNFWYEE